MLFEDFDKKIKEAAENHHPAYDVKAWSKMNKLLDRHMPVEEDDRRRIFLLLFLFILLGGGIYYFLRPGHTSSQKKELAVQQPVNAGNSESTMKSEGPSNNHNTISINPGSNSNNTNNNNKNTAGQDVQPLVINKTAQQPSLIVQHTKTNPGKLLVSNNKSSIFKDRSSTLKDKNVNQPTVDDKNNISPVAKPGEGSNKIVTNSKDQTATTDPEVNKNDQKEPSSVAGNPTTNDQKKNEPGKINALPKADQQNSISKESKKKPANQFFISATAGPDASMAGTSSPGKMKLIAGAGVGFTIHDKVTLRSGFYTARKIYTATAEDYHASSEFYQYYPNFQKAEADCKVYEIPLSASYNFSRKNGHNLFASAGLSTYLMKRETYNFYYKYTATGPTVNRSYTLRNANNHILSVIDLSAGYQKKIGKNFSIMAEPYLKIPLTGIGFGNVKLNSGGILFTATYNPFHKKGK
jgi:hypothetical protein